MHQRIDADGSHLIGFANAEEQGVLTRGDFLGDGWGRGYKRIAGEGPRSKVA
jgi:hypothetical protein